MPMPLLLALAFQAAAAPPPAAPREIEVQSAFQATPSGLNRYLGDNDYPAEARRAHEQGIVRFHIAIGTDGRVSDCTITGPSGHAVLDAATCALARDRFRFVPGLDEYGRPTTDEGDYVMTWRLPA